MTLNRDDTQAAISRHLPRRARKRLPLIMEVVDMHAKEAAHYTTETLREQMATSEIAQDKLNADHAATVRKLTEQNAALRGETNLLRAARDGFRQDADAAHERLADEVAESNRLRERVKHLEHTLQETRGDLARSDDHRRRLVDELAEVRAKLTDAIREAGASAAERDRLREQLAAVKDLAKARGKARGAGTRAAPVPGGDAQTHADA